MSCTWLGSDIFEFLQLVRNKLGLYVFKIYKNIKDEYRILSLLKSTQEGD
jgi:hypothetical protein